MASVSIFQREGTAVAEGPAGSGMSKGSSWMGTDKNYIPHGHGCLEHAMVVPTDLEVEVGTTGRRQELAAIVGARAIGHGIVFDLRRTRSTQQSRKTWSTPW